MSEGRGINSSFNGDENNLLSLGNESSRSTLIENKEEPKV